MFVTFEGVEGSGKTTQIEWLRKSLAERGCRVFVTREPGGDPVSERIRSMLLDYGEAMAPLSELFLFLAARAQLVREEIRPRLCRGEVVLCDRFTDSTVAYQGYGRGLDLVWIRDLNQRATDGLVPDVTFLLDIDPRIGLGRQAQRNRIEEEALEFHLKVREGYLKEARASGSGVLSVADSAGGTRAASRFCKIDAALPIDEIRHLVLERVEALLEDPNRRPD